MRPMCFSFFTFLVFFSGETSAFDWKRLFDPFGIFHRSDPEASMTVHEVIRYHGYPVEEYEVVTDDGYILSMQRIPHGKSNKETDIERKPVLLMHGIVAASTCWIANTPDKNLPYLLAERNYDVWIGNFRGNSLSRRHKSLSPDEKQFWMFSFDEMAKHDLISMIDFILEKTKFKQLHYIGHSMGTTVAFILLSLHPEYNMKIRSMHALAPVARLDHTRSPLLKMVISFEKLSISLTKIFMGYEYLPSSKVNNLVGQTVCKWLPSDFLCSNAVFLVTGFDSEQFNATRLPVYLHFFPAGTSTQAIEHFGQIGYYHRFQAFDHGKKKNMELYHQETPPLCNASLIKTPVALYYGENDWIAGPQDVQWLIQNLGNLVLDYKIPLRKFNHADFLWAKDVIPLLYEKLFETMDKLWEH